jgi:glycosyltransferase involved in cell wall biosynthesis
MKLQLLIPQYKETEEIIKPLLDSLAIQQNVDFNEIGVIITNDGTDIHLSSEFLNSYPFKIEYYLDKHRGVSATRNACLDRATADYVMFCDADDMFYNACGLWIIFQEIQNGFDYLISLFVEETRFEGKPSYINREMDTTFVHGKVIRRGYLLEKGIRWNDNLTIHEDSYFNCLCKNLTPNVRYCPAPFYLWKWRDDSVCRSDLKYILKTYNNMLESSTALVNELNKRGHYNEAQFYAVGLIFDAYYLMNKKEWLDQENKEYRHNTELRFKKYYEDFKVMFDNMPYANKLQVAQGVRNRYYQEGLLVESVTFEAWIKHIVEDL